MTARILVVDDSPSDVGLIREALRQINSTAELSVVEDGEEAIDYILRRGRHAAAARPHLVLLDLNLPRKSGTEVLREIKADATIKGIPVVILSSSRSTDEILHCYDCHANSYVAKPEDLDDFYEAIKNIHLFWLDTVELPGRMRQ